MGIGEIRTHAATDEYRSGWDRIFRGGHEAPLFIINGEDVRPEGKFLTMEEAMRAALAASHNTGRPCEEWELRSEDGALHDASRALGPETARERFFMTLRVGVGG